MEKFPDGAHVWLRSRDHGGYLKADEDGRGVSLSLGGSSSNVQWTVVHCILHDGSTLILLRSAAHHGRYLAASSDLQAPRGLRVFLAQGDYDDRSMWKTVELGNSGYVLLLHISNHLLRATGRRQNGVCLDVAHSESTMTHWTVETIPGPAPASPLAVAMPASDADAAPRLPAFDFFPDSEHVRLRIRDGGSYMFAAKDGVRIDFSSHRATLDTVWVVHQVERQGTFYVLLHSAAYGRYLACSSEPQRTGLWVQNHYFHVEAQEILWEPSRASSDTLGSAVKLRNVKRKLYIGEFDVELVPLRARPPLLPDPSDMVEHDLTWRNVLYILGDGYGNYSQRGWRKIRFQGCSVTQLRDKLAEQLEEQQSNRIVLCFWSGYMGRLTPLSVDLPSNNYTIKIIVYVSWSRASLALRYPNVDTLEPTTGIWEQD